jgi:hypothetical protein
MRPEPNVEASILEMDETQVEAWTKPVVCRVEVDLPNWMAELTGHKNWEVFNEEETDDYMSYAMRLGRQEAEVTLYHSGYAVVDVDGESLFNGTLTNGKNACAQLSYFNPENGEPITFN